MCYFFDVVEIKLENEDLEYIILCSGFFLWIDILVIFKNVFNLEGVY